MSGGGGGFYKFRCKYFLSHECPNWVYVNGSACASCSAQGRDIEPAASQAPRYSPEVSIPVIEGGAVTRYEVEQIPPNNFGYHWGVRPNVERPSQPQVPTTTSALPGTPTTTSF
ncbi:hypothetical protein F5Y10DRAFT_143835 [Nemania abortiva]|nr:hypothetical protein F5Y10DRAFT_143835 [Nemania abortiva]